MLSDGRTFFEKKNLPVVRHHLPNDVVASGCQTRLTVLTGLIQAQQTTPEPYPTLILESGLRRDISRPKQPQKPAFGNSDPSHARKERNLPSQIGRASCRERG